MSQGFTVEDLDYAVTNAEKWGIIDGLEGPILVSLFAEFNQEVSPEDSVVGRRSILRALENKHLRTFDHDTNFQNRLKGLMTSLASIATKFISSLLK